MNTRSVHTVGIHNEQINSRSVLNAIYDIAVN